jgi:hypothetical protein
LADIPWRISALNYAGNAFFPRKNCEVAEMVNLFEPQVASSHGNGQVQRWDLSFLSMEDETGIANVIVTPDLYERQRLVVTRSKFILAEGPLQNQDGVIHVKASRLLPLSDQTLEIRSHDFH